MSWTPQNSSHLAALLEETDFWVELSLIKPQLGGETRDDRADSATKRLMWEEVEKRLREMARPQEEDDNQPESYIEVGELDKNIK